MFTKVLRLQPYHQLLSILDLYYLDFRIEFHDALWMLFLLLLISGSRILNFSCLLYSFAFDFLGIVSYIVHILLLIFTFFSGMVSKFSLKCPSFQFDHVPNILYHASLCIVLKLFIVLLSYSCSCYMFIDEWFFEWIYPT